MPIPTTIEPIGHASNARATRKRLAGWRLAVLAIATACAMSGLALAWIGMDGGLLLVLIVIAGLCGAAYVFWSLFNAGTPDGTTPELNGTSEWEARIRSNLPQHEQAEIDSKRRSEGDEA